MPWKLNSLSAPMECCSALKSGKETFPDSDREQPDACADHGTDRGRNPRLEQQVVG